MYCFDRLCNCLKIVFCKGSIFLKGSCAFSCSCHWLCWSFWSFCWSFWTFCWSFYPLSPHAGDDLQEPGSAAVAVVMPWSRLHPCEAKSRFLRSTRVVWQDSHVLMLSPLFLCLGETPAATRINGNVLISPHHHKACLLLSPVCKLKKETVKLPLSYTFSPFSSPILCLHRRPRFGSDRATW